VTRSVLLPLCALTVLAQRTVPEHPTERGPRAQFEVATLKANKSGAPASWSPGAKNDGFMAQNATLRDLLVFAYRVRNFQISGPPWIESERYDVNARLPSAASADAAHEMLQALLEERLSITTHRELLDQKVYALIVAKGGPKIHELRPGEEFKPQFPRGAPMFLLLSGDMARWGETLTAQVDRPVIDNTGLSGSYSFMLGFEKLNKEGSAFPDVFGAVEQQLGLKLEPQRAKIEMLFIDHADKVPQDN
jgi:uncharacterized protein (TIGR03435 family)